LKLYLNYQREGSVGFARKNGERRLGATVAADQRVTVGELIGPRDIVECLDVA